MACVLLQTDVHIDDNNEDAKLIRCANTRAVGCSDDLVKDVEILARLVDPPRRSALCIRTDDDRGQDFVLSGQGQAFGHVEAAADGLIVLSSRFLDRQRRPGPELLLVYDGADESLTVVPHPTARPCHWQSLPSYTWRPLPLRRLLGGPYTLAIMARYALYDSQAGRHVRRDVLCLWPPPPGSSTPLLRSQASIEPWQVKEARFPPGKPYGFCADVAFSFQGQAFWADLARGILYCDHDDVLPDAHQVHFRYVQLPPRCRVLTAPQTVDDRIELGRSRSMSCVGDAAIKMVCIEDMVICMWLLDPASGQWRRDVDDFHVASMWEMQGFKESGLPETAPIYPVLSTQEDGVLYFALEQHEQKHLCGLNMRTKRFLPSGYRSNSAPSAPPHVLASDFFKHLHE